MGFEGVNKHYFKNKKCYSKLKLLLLHTKQQDLHNNLDLLLL